MDAKKTFLTVIALLAFPAILRAITNAARYRWAKIIAGQTLRSDSAGDGRYGAPRGSRKHRGVDLLVTSPGQVIYAPFDAKATRVAYPYADDLRWTGIELAGSGDWTGYSVKMFYMEPYQALIGGMVNKGEPIGTAQAISTKYPGQGMRDHVHVELWKDGVNLDPTKLLFE